MKVVCYPEILPCDASAVTVGFFDGVHLGHRFLISELLQEASKATLASVVVTFVDHPRKVTLSSYQPQLLTTVSDKINLIGETGVDYCYLIDFTSELASMSAQRFMLDVLVERLGACFLLMGYDHRFGSDRLSGLDLYRNAGQSIGLEVAMASAFECKGERVSSSLVRRSLQSGAVLKASQLLGRPHRLVGMVVHGRKVGRKLGFPTANISVNRLDRMVPCNGVYLVHVIHDRISKYGMMNLGNRPSFYIDGECTIEVYLFDFEGDLYGEILQIDLLEYIRPERKFNSLDELIEQLKEDERMCRLMVGD